MKSRKTLPIYLLSLFLAVSPSPGFSQGEPITAAYNRLRMFNSLTEAGVSYASFRDEWGQVRGVIDIAIQDSKPSSLTQKLSEIKTTYTEAAEFWRCTIEVNYTGLMNMCLGKRSASSNPIIGPSIQEILDKRENFDVKTRDIAPIMVPLYFKLADAQILQLGLLLKQR